MQDAGIAVPVCILPAARKALAAAGSSAELPASGEGIAEGVVVCMGYRFSQGAGAGDSSDGGSSCKPPKQASLPGSKSTSDQHCQRQQEPIEGSAAEQRRDTPLMHIAARHQQAEAAARREVQRLLQKRGSGIVSLMQQP